MPTWRWLSISLRTGSFPQITSPQAYTSPSAVKAMPTRESNPDATCERPCSEDSITAGSRHILFAVLHQVARNRSPQKHSGIRFQLRHNLSNSLSLSRFLRMISGLRLQLSKSRSRPGATDPSLQVVLAANVTELLQRQRLQVGLAHISRQCK